MPSLLISQLLYLLDDAFQGPDWESLLTNLSAVRPEDWLWVPPGGRRSICEIVRHIGGCKYMYQDQAFGDAMLSWDDPLVQGGAALDRITAAIEWLRGGHARLRASIAALDDEELPRLRRHHSGKMKETRWIIWTMIQHDVYHAGEINHIRALRQGDDE